MTTLDTKPITQAIVTDVRFDDYMMQVVLQDGLTISVPIEWFPKLRDATREQRAHWRLIGDGIGIVWPSLDEDISVAGLLGS